MTLKLAKKTLSPESEEGGTGPPAVPRHGLEYFSNKVSYSVLDPSSQLLRSLQASSASPLHSG